MKHTEIRRDRRTISRARQLGFIVSPSVSACAEWQRQCEGRRQPYVSVTFGPRAATIYLQLPGGKEFGFVRRRVLQRNFPIAAITSDSLRVTLPLGLALGARVRELTVLATGELPARQRAPKLDVYTGGKPPVFPPQSRRVTHVRR